MAEAATRDQAVLVEEYIRGREFTVAVLDGKALPIIEIRAPEGDYDFNNKYFGDAVSYDCPTKLNDAETASLSATCEQYFKAIGARGWSRIDAMQRPDGSFVLLEINTSPGMTPHSLVPMAARAVGMVLWRPLRKGLIACRNGLIAKKTLAQKRMHIHDTKENSDLC